jgi:hypothetical protein
VLQNVVSTILTLRISREKFLISLGWNTTVAIDIAAAKLEIEMVPIGIVCDRNQHLGLHPNPVHLGPSNPFSQAKRPEQYYLFTPSLPHELFTHACRKLTKIRTTR